MWKDRVNIELTVAVLESYKAACVAIVQSCPPGSVASAMLASESPRDTRGTARDRRRIARPLPLTAACTAAR